jgi:hypothetical protein
MFETSATALCGTIGIYHYHSLSIPFYTGIKNVQDLNDHESHQGKPVAM